MCSVYSYVYTSTAELHDYVLLYVEIKAPCRNSAWLRYTVLLYTVQYTGR